MKIDVIGNNEEFIIYRKKIENFLAILDVEKEFFNLDMQRVRTFTLILVALNCNEVIGLAGLGKKHGLARSYIIIRKDFQGKGLGKHLMLNLLSEAAKKHILVLGVVNEKNIESIKMHLSIGYKKGGKRGNLLYIFNSLNTKGVLVYYLIKALFPMLGVLDGRN